MKIRFGLVAVAGLVVAAAGCASGGSSAPELGPDGQPIPEASRPRDDNFTTSATLYLTQAQSATDAADARERYSLADEAARNALNNNPSNPLAMLLGARTAAGLGQYERADSLYTQAELTYPPYAGEIEALREDAWVQNYNEAIGYLNAGDTENAIAAFSRADQIFKGRPEAMLQLGALYSQVGDFDMAAQKFREVLDLVEGTDYALADSMRVAGWDEYEIQAARFLGQVLTQAERYDEAAAEYQEFLAANPGDVTIMSQLAMVTMAAGDTASAERMYGDLLNMEGITAGELYDVGVGLFQVGAYAQSAQAFRQAVAIAPNHRDAMFNLVTALYQSQQWDEVIAVGEDLQALDPNNPLAFQYAAFAYAQSGDSDTGIALQERGQNLPFTIDNTRLVPVSSGGASLTGQLTNKTLAPGATVDMEIHFVAEDGSDAGMVPVTVVAPEVDMAEVFQAEFDSDQQIIGFFYVVRSGS